MGVKGEPGPPAPPDPLLEIRAKYFWDFIFEFDLNSARELDDSWFGKFEFDLKLLKDLMNPGLEVGIINLHFTLIPLNDLIKNRYVQLNLT